jgi:competence protein ComEC
VLASALVQIIDGVSLAESFLDGVNREYILDKTEDDMSWLNESIPLVLIVILIFICLSPVHRRIKLVVSGLVLLVLVVKPRQGSQFEIWFLDVGQAQSVVAVKDNRALVYDVGFGRDGFNASDAVIVPFLKSRHIRSVDHLIVSHKDTDHSGGLKSLLESAYAPRHLVIPESLDHVMINAEGLGQSADVSRCNKDQRFLWGEVEVHYLWPKEEHKELSSNDSSCVVFLEYQGVSILLTGDVTASVESKLIEQYEARLKKVDIMSVPHHGSKTSSSPEFLDAVDARWAVSSSGSLNRFNHPAPTIVDRYQVRGIKFFSTAESGALGFIVDEELDIEIAHWLSKEEAYWRSNRWGK